MRRTCAGLAGLVVLVASLLTACGSSASSVKQAVSSIAASHSGSVTQSAGTPSASAAPSTAAPSTAASQAAPAPAASTGAPASGGSGFPWAWFWVIVAIVLVAGLSIWAIARHRRRASAASSWQTRVIDAYAKGAALHDAMAAAETPAALAAPDAGLRWSDIQRRADDYGQLLYGMRQAAPGDQERILISDVIASLQAVRSALDAERSAGTTDGMLSGIARDRISFFASSLRALREPDVHPV